MSDFLSLVSCFGQWRREAGGPILVDAPEAGRRTGSQPSVPTVRASFPIQGRDARFVSGQMAFGYADETCDVDGRDRRQDAGFSVYSARMCLA